MNATRRLMTANRLLELLNRLGVSKMQAAEDLGIGRTTVFNWQNAETSPESSVIPPTDEQLGVLSRLLLEKLRNQQQELMTILGAEDLRLETRREMMDGLQALNRHALEQMQSTSDAWSEMDRDLAQLVEKHGPDILDRLSDSTTVSMQFDTIARPLCPRMLPDEKPYRKEDDTIEVPPALLDKRHRYKYLAVLDVLLHASLDASAGDLAAQVRRLFPRGTFLPYRIAEDLGHILRGDGVYANVSRSLTAKEIAHLERLRENLRERGELVR